MGQHGMVTRGLDATERALQVHRGIEIAGFH
jgi:hypothetical protein